MCASLRWFERIMSDHKAILKVYWSAENGKDFLKLNLKKNNKTWYLEYMEAYCCHAIEIKTDQYHI